MILDTDALSAVVEGDPVLAPLLRKAAQIAIPIIVLGEYRYGISHSRNRRHYEEWLMEYSRNFRILEEEERTTIPYGRFVAN